MTDGVAIWRALSVIMREVSNGKNIENARLIKQDGASYKIIDGMIMSSGKLPVPLIIDINDTWTIKWLVEV